jgi:rRNA pseudouridine-1189 N-methylase Emg1 (Nep1/Mra1 family)
MEQLFQRGFVPNKEEELMKMKRNMPLKKVMDELNADMKIALSSKGKRSILCDYFGKINYLKNKNMAFVIGGFPKGGFLSPIDETVDDVISIYPKSVPAWTAASEVIVNYEICIGIGEPMIKEEQKE